MAKYNCHNLFISYKAELRDMECNQDFISQYLNDGDHLVTTGSVAALRNFACSIAEHIILDIFILRVADGELLHVHQTPTRFLRRDGSCTSHRSIDNHTTACLKALSNDNVTYTSNARATCYQLNSNKKPHSSTPSKSESSQAGNTLPV
eukprot:jgi/Chlat1/4409/Chrsp29S04622